MIYTLKEIAQVVAGEIYGNPDKEISSVFIDSRSFAIKSESIFIAIKGERHNGHIYIPELIQRGIDAFIVSELPEQEKESANFVLVKDSLIALQRLAAHYRSQFDCPVIGITGSNGKTIVKEWLFQLLNKDFNIARSPKSYNSQVGVPLSVFQLNKDNDLAIFEAGISLSGEMEKLEEIIRPTMGIITNLGAAHQENFKSLYDKAKEKIILLSKCEKIIFCRDYPEIEKAIKDKHIPEDRLISWSGKDKNASLFITELESGNHFSKIKAIYKKKELQISIPLTDSASLENAVVCWLTMLELGISSQKISEGMKLLRSLEMRLEVKTGVNNCTIINDSYSLDPNSLQIALDFLQHQSQQDRKTVILSDMHQSGLEKKKLYSEVFKLLKKNKVTRLFGIGPDLKNYSSCFDMNTAFYENSVEFFRNVHVSDFSNEAVLVKGARTFELEKISAFLERKVHITRLEIDLNALVENLNYFRELLNPGTKIMAMVKAFSYGSGIAEIARVLQYQQIDYLGVAYADEGVELRNSGISTPILVMAPDEAGFDKIINFNLEPEIYSIEMLKRFITRSENAGRKSHPIHVKLDTGMHRLGFRIDEIDNVIDLLKKSPDVKVVSMFSHLAASDDRQMDTFTNDQIELFRKGTDKIISALKINPLRHILNSSGVERFSDSQFEMVRLGIGLHGVSAVNSDRLKQTGCLKTSIVQIRDVPADQTIGYGRKGILKRNSRIAVIAIGYADGFNRQFSNGAGYCWINGKMAPVVGNVCMDMTMLDVTDIDCSAGDEVEIFGRHISITGLASILNTIPYEVLTSVSSRVRRVYYHE